MAEGEDHRGVGIPDVALRAERVRVGIGLDEAAVSLGDRAVLRPPPARNPAARCEPKLEGDVESGSIRARLTTRYELLDHSSVNAKAGLVWIKRERIPGAVRREAAPNIPPTARS